MGAGMETERKISLWPPDRALFCRPGPPTLSQGARLVSQLSAVPTQTRPPLLAPHGWPQGTPPTPATRAPHCTQVPSRLFLPLWAPPAPCSAQSWSAHLLLEAFPDPPTPRLCFVSCCTSSHTYFLEIITFREAHAVSPKHTEKSYEVSLQCTWVEAAHKQAGGCHSCYRVGSGEAGDKTSVAVLSLPRPTLWVTNRGISPRRSVTLWLPCGR